MNEFETLELEHLLWVNITQVKHSIERAWTRELKNLNLSTEKFAILHELMCLGGESTPHTLARRIVFEPHSVSAIVSRMEKDGLIIKTKDLDKKHMVRIKLSEKAIDTFYQALEISNRVYKQMMASITREEKVELSKTLTKLRNHTLPLTHKHTKTLTPFKYI
ncbi:MAG: MarR family transcriptional regulator [Dehalococcoides mccartyi]|uniref:MarR family winged helix-turn-helix transcriptional regulator n=1 Tax=Dehalococcoides mccartyi TaxID=61435 RepID=UPI0008056058|nr:MarR family transcriptional regulator [Dehalococcoides mccartyi]OBW62751.1 MAG: MarR family transcriptional regulator [Dehalococcoides mccartyi]